jgi:hypothetical protein
LHVASALLRVGQPGHPVGSVRDAALLRGKSGGGYGADRTGLRVISLIHGNLQGKYAFWAHLVIFHAVDICEFSALATVSLLKLTGNIFDGSGNKI